MNETSPIPSRIDRRIVGEPLQVDGRTVQPVARLHGRLGSGGGPSGAIAGGQLRLDPVEVIVREAGGESTLILSDPTAAALRSMLVAAAAVAAVSITLNSILWLMRRR